MKGTLPTWGWMILGVLLLLSFGIDFANTIQGGAIDLRNRITGARLMEHGIDAYHYKWTEGDPEEYCDVYNNPKLPVSKTTATPALLMLNMPLAALRYRPAQYLWFLLQWMLLVGTGWLWLRMCKADWQRLFIALAVVGFTFTAAWRLHAERGQAYVLLGFLFAVWLTLTLERKWGFGTGCLAGFLMALRPPFLLLLPFMALHRRGQLAGAAIGVLLGVGLPLLINPASWSNYFAGMGTHSELYRNDIDPRPGPHAYPPMVESMSTDTLGNYVTIPYADSSVYVLMKSLGFEKNPMTGIAIPAWPVFATLVIMLVGWLWLSRRQSAERLLLGFAAWFFIADFFLPAFRNNYNDVLILDVIALGIVTATKIPWAIWPCAVALPLGWAVYLCVPEDAWIINLPTTFFTLGAVGFLLLQDHKAKDAV